MIRFCKQRSRKIKNCLDVIVEASIKASVPSARQATSTCIVPNGTAFGFGKPLRPCQGSALPCGARCSPQELARTRSMERERLSFPDRVEGGGIRCARRHEKMCELGCEWNTWRMEFGGWCAANESARKRCASLACTCIVRIIHK